jgi:lactoylglutathione lyase
MKNKLLFTLLIAGNPLIVRAQDKPSFKFNHLAVFVVDLKQSRHFYADILGLDTIPEPFLDGKHVWMNTGCGGSIHIISGAEKRKEYFQNNHLCLSTSNMDEFKTRLEKNKIKWRNAQGQVGQMTTRPDGVLQIWLDDPDGYHIEINNDYH